MEGNESKEKANKSKILNSLICYARKTMATKCKVPGPFITLILDN